MASRADIRIYTVSEANTAIEDLVHILPAMRNTVLDIEKAESRLAILDLICDRTVSSDNNDLQEYLSLRVKYHQKIREFEGMLAHLTTEGYLLRDLDRGIVHFTAKRGVVDVLLCWTEGEAKVSHWHRVDEDGLADEEQRFDVENWDEF